MEDRFVQSKLPALVHMYTNYARLESTSMNESTLNFLLYIPPAAFTPLEIRLADGSALPSNGWLIPQFGGVVILNMLSNDSSASVPTIELDPKALEAALGVRPHSRSAYTLISSLSCYLDICVSTSPIAWIS